MIDALIYIKNFVKPIATQSSDVEADKESYPSLYIYYMYL